MERAERYNEGKVDWSQVDLTLLEPMIRVLMYGEKKYHKYNWKKGAPISELIGCLMRHLTSFMDGEDIDKESGQPHLGHAMSNLMMMINTMKNRKELDDRYEEGKDYSSKKADLEKQDLEFPIYNTLGEQEEVTIPHLKNHNMYDLCKVKWVNEGIIEVGDIVETLDEDCFPNLKCEVLNIKFFGDLDTIYILSHRTYEDGIARAADEVKLVKKKG